MHSYTLVSDKKLPSPYCKERKTELSVDIKKSINAVIP